MNWKTVALLGLLVAAAQHVDSKAASKAAASTYSVGVGLADITGPSVEIGMMGYASPSQSARGIHMRLFARAFIFESKEDNKGRVVFVSADLAMIGQAVKHEVSRKLAEKYPGVYTSQNILISATHTHSGPAGYMQHILHNIASFGFVKDNFNGVVDGIVEAVSRAHDKMTDAHVYLSKGRLEGSNINRSPSAYLANPASERSRYSDDVDKEMVLLRIDRASDQKPLGTINWFAVHPTSMNNTNSLISGDNKGYASQLFEQHMEPGQLVGKTQFAAAFASSNLGDVSPNIMGPRCINTGETCDVETSSCDGYPTYCIAFGPGNFGDMKESTKKIGENQFMRAWELWKSAGHESTRININGPVHYAHQYVNMTNYQLTYEGRNVTTCPAAMGYSFAAGTIDGPGAFNFTQGDTTGNPFWNFVRDMLQAPSREQIQCHGSKPILLDIGETFFPMPWIPAVVETQVLRIGNLFIVGVPGELTTMSGRRLRESVRTKVISQVPDAEVVIAGLSNGYTHYITTFEEYNVQRYEGASTLYGPYTLAAYQDQFAKLSEAVLTEQQLETGPVPPLLIKGQLSFNPPIIMDMPPLMKKFGDCIQKPYSYAFQGEVIKASFVSGHPRNNPMRGGTFFLVEQKEELPDNTTRWIPVASDAEWSTEFKWRRTFPLLPYSEIDISWETSTFTEPGTYRIRHFGYSKPMLRSAVPFSGVTPEFKIAKRPGGTGIAAPKRVEPEVSRLWTPADFWRYMAARSGRSSDEVSSQEVLM